MPINLDSCITGIFIPGNIGASSGQTPVQPTVPSFSVGNYGVGVARGVGSAMGDAHRSGIGTAAGVGAASATGAVGAPSDSNYSNVVFLWEAEGTNNQTAGLVDAKNSRAITCSGTGKISTTQARIGSTSFFVGTGGMSSPNNADYQLGNTSNASPFTIEFSAYEGTLQTWEAILFWSGSETSWWIRLQADGQIRLLASSTGTSSFSMDVTTTGFGMTAGAWADICIEKDATGKIRFYRNGVMKYSTTPADSKFFASTNSLLTFGTQPSSDGYIDHFRLTKSVARYATDSSYTFDATPYPTS